MIKNHPIKKSLINFHLSKWAYQTLVIFQTFYSFVQCLKLHLRDDLSRKSPLKFGISPKIGGEGSESWKSRNFAKYDRKMAPKPDKFLLGTDRKKFSLSVLVEADIPRGGGV